MHYSKKIGIFIIFNFAFSVQKRNSAFWDQLQTRSFGNNPVQPWSYILQDYYENASNIGEDLLELVKRREQFLISFKYRYEELFLLDFPYPWQLPDLLSKITSTSLHIRQGHKQIEPMDLQIVKNSAFEVSSSPFNWKIDFFLEVFPPCHCQLCVFR